MSDDTINEITSMAANKALLDGWHERPVAIMFFPNGMAAVFNQWGGQMGKYQGAGKHPEVIAALKADGYDWRDMRVDGFPMEHGSFVDNLGNPMPVEDQ